MDEKEVREKLEALIAPQLGRSLGDLNLIRNINCSGHGIELELAAPTLNGHDREILGISVTRALGGPTNIKFSYAESKPAELNQVDNVIAVMSGKGGVGKSLVSALIAVGLRRQGKRVGILDADITGASMPRMFGLKASPAGSSEGIMPVLSAAGIPMMSINLLLGKEDEAVIWRGPLIARAITQFWNDVYWSRLDYLVIDLPPGTADAPLTVIKSLPVAGLVIVSTPQALSNMVVRKAVSMARSTGTRILGVVENMSYLYLADINRRIELFGPSRGQELAKTAGAPLLAEIPVDTDLAKLCDSGRIEEYESEVVGQLAQGVAKALSRTQKGGNHDDRK